MSRLLEAILDRLPQLVHVVDADGRYLYVNTAMARALGFEPSDVIGKTPKELLGPAPNTARLMREVNEVLRTGDSIVMHEVEVFDPDGRGRMIRNDRSALPLEATEGIPAVLTISQDITEMKQAEAALRQRAMYDSLTALPNRLLFLERMRHGLETLSRRGARRIGVLFCDIDGFKSVNDTHGHAAGDQVLVDVAARLRRALRPHDTVARYGGDEFAVLVHRVSDYGILALVASRLQTAMGSPVELANGTELTVTLSIGGAIAQRPDGRSESLLEIADRAMYRAKRQGPGLTEIEGYEPTDSGRDVG